MKNELHIKKAQHKCGVRGCRNTVGVYAISRTREAGHTILMCMECAEMAAEAIIKFRESYTEPKPIVYVSPFFNAGVADITEEPDIVVTNEVDMVEELGGDTKPTDDSLNCQYCNRECGSRVGLSSHERHCKEKINL